MNQPLPTYSLRSIEIKNFKGIKHAIIEDLPREAKWIFLTGRNGFGKTCVLQSIFIGLFGQRDKNLILSEENFKITIGHSDRNNPNELIANDFYFIEEIGGRHKEKSNRIPLVAFGSSRLNIRGSQTRNEETDRSSPSYSLFNPDGVLLSVETELKNLYYRSQVEKLDPASKKQLSERYEGIRKTLLQLMPNLADISIDAKEDKILYTEKDDENDILTEGLTFNELASGNRSIIAMIGDMLIRLFKYRPMETVPGNLEGIVIIDELDLHLHPSWQQALPTLLSEIFPKVQFIASTHSPIPFLGAPEGSVFLKVNRTEEEGITLEKLDIDISDLTPNLILSSPIFGFTNIIPITHEKGERIRTEDTMQEAAMNDAIRQKLTDFLGKEKEEELRKLFKKG